MKKSGIIKTKIKLNNGYQMYVICKDTAVEDVFFFAVVVSTKQKEVVTCIEKIN